MPLRNQMVLPNGTRESDWSPHSSCHVCERTVHLGAKCSVHNRCLTCCARQRLSGCWCVNQGASRIAVSPEQALQAERDRKEMF